MTTSGTKVASGPARQIFSLVPHSIPKALAHKIVRFTLEKTAGPFFFNFGSSIWTTENSLGDLVILDHNPGVSASVVTSL